MFAHKPKESRLPFCQNPGLISHSFGYKLLQVSWAQQPRMIDVLFAQYLGDTLEPFMRLASTSALFETHMYGVRRVIGRLQST